MVRFAVVLGSFGLALATSGASAQGLNDVVVDGQVTKACSIPANVALASFENSEVCLIAEQQSVTLSDPVTIDGAMAGTYKWNMQQEQALAAGTRLDSFLLHFNPNLGFQLSRSVVGTLMFARPVLGLVFDSNSLDATRLPFGLPIDYGNSQTIGTFDSLTLANDLHTLQINLTVSVFEPADQIRILIASSPLPPNGETDAGNVAMDAAVSMPASGDETGALSGSIAFADGKVAIADRPYSSFEGGGGCGLAPDAMPHWLTLLLFLGLAFGIARRRRIGSSLEGVKSIG